jgi:hypothetical protein
MMREPKALTASEMLDDDSSRQIHQLEKDRRDQNAVQVNEDKRGVVFVGNGSQEEPLTKT